MSAIQVTLDTILAGPILRRTTYDRICIWLATSIEPEAPQITVFPRESSGDSPLATRTEHNTIRIGESLWVSLIHGICTNDSLFPTDTILTYDLTLADKTLDELGLLGEYGINYPGFQLPAFIIPDKPGLITHGSCRKPHGKGLDVFPRLDRLLRTHGDTPVERPTVLFLTGDQIYADDVDRDLLGHITSVGKSLGIKEQIPTLPTLPGPGRKQILKHYAGFTTTKGHNHLMTLAEYTVMHLLAFSPTLWEGAVDASAIREYRENVWLARRVMANVPTYMMFDDHEVTDDWYLDEDWRNSVLIRPLGERIIVNGLLAYFLCQGWGNKPEKPSFIKQVERLIQTRANAGFLLDQNWSYIAPTNPAALVIDTRTQRVGVGNSMELVNTAAFAVLGKRIDAAKAEGLIDTEQPVLIVSPPPVFGLPAIEVLQNRFAPLLGAQTLDYEYWFTKAFQRLLNFLPDQGFKEAIILSGDVHYALNMHAFTNRLKVYQFVSSSMKNHARSLQGFIGKAISWLQLARSIFNFRRFRRKQNGTFSFSWNIVRLRRGNAGWRLRPKYLVSATNFGKISIEPDVIRHELLCTDDSIWIAELPRDPK